MNYKSGSGGFVLLNSSIQNGKIGLTKLAGEFELELKSKTDLHRPEFIQDIPIPQRILELNRK